MRVVPSHWDDHGLRGDPAFAARLRRWAERGAEMLVHGWYHKDLAHHSGLAALKARPMTAREGEFLCLTREEVACRMTEGRAVAGFIAPDWLYGEGAREALTQRGFARAEDHIRVWRRGAAEIIARGQAVSWASRSPMHTASLLALARLVRTAPQPLATVRVAVHPGDITKPAIIDSIERTLAAFTRWRTPGGSADLIQ